MSDALNETLEQVFRRLERGIREAEDELAETRERCTRLELVIRSLRAQGSELAKLQHADPLGGSGAVPWEAVVRIPEAAPVATAAPTAKPVAAKATPAARPDAAKATPAPRPAAAPAAASNGSDPAPEPPGTDDAEPGVIEIPTSYMPMLEELWDVARNTESE